MFGISGGSGGYLEYTFKRAAKELFNVDVTEISYKTVRDINIATLEVEGKPVLSFATAYGFKNIQNIVRKIKGTSRQVCPYDFVEIMACPSGMCSFASIAFGGACNEAVSVPTGCLNGGGQIKAEKTQEAKQLLKNVEALYHQQIVTTPEQNAAAQELSRLWFDGVFSPTAHSQLHTQYHAREKMAVNPLNIKW